MTIKIFVVIGTRPEAIKMIPVFLELKKRQEFEPLIVATGQHRELLAQTLSDFNLAPDIDLDIMQAGQPLNDITVRVLQGMDKLLSEHNPDVVLVHGDTTTSMAAGIAAFYREIPVGHVEAGLRSFNTKEPFPEEFNRVCVDGFANYLFAPTDLSRQNLLDEHKDPAKIIVTGNTAIDTLKLTVPKEWTDENLEWAEGSRLILVTVHRRENLGENMFAIFSALRRIADDFSDVKMIYPVHLNPKVRKTADEILSGHERIRLIDPLPTVPFHNYMKKSHFIVTDSGGIQEEAPSMNKPVLVTRNVTERPEGATSGTLKLSGVTEEGLYTDIKMLLTDNAIYEKMANAENPYGDGNASKRIADFLAKI
jgi:UDP-N-acetylglucosamine 2-epimerase (non-hydrolysing)